MYGEIVVAADRDQVLAEIARLARAPVTRASVDQYSAPVSLPDDGGNLTLAPGAPGKTEKVRLRARLVAGCWVLGFEPFACCEGGRRALADDERARLESLLRRVAERLQRTRSFGGAAVTPSPAPATITLDLEVAAARRRAMTARGSGGHPAAAAQPACAERAVGKRIRLMGSSLPSPGSSRSGLRPA